MSRYLYILDGDRPLVGEDVRVRLFSEVVVHLVQETGVLLADVTAGVPQRDAPRVHALRHRGA